MARKPTNRRDRDESDLSVRMMIGAGHQASIGDDLRIARQARGEDLQDIAAQLRIRFVYLEAIERGAFDSLPGPTYAIGFVRAYARYLRLDAEEMIARFKIEASGIDAPSDLTFPEPVSESRVPRGGLVIIALLLAVAAYGGWYYLSTRDASIADMVPSVPSDFPGSAAPVVPAAPAAQAPAPAPADTTAIPAVPTLTGPVPSQLIPGSAAPVTENGPRIYGEGNEDARIVLRARGDSWVQIRAADDSLVMTRTLRSGDSYRVPNQSGLKLMTGNAGALEIMVDNQATPSLGPFGAVRRNVVLDAERLKAGTAAPN
jgi:cytoskeleton protein RodZ